MCLVLFCFCRRLTNIVVFCFFSAAQYAPDKLEDFIDTINSRLQPMFMQIRKGMSENNGLQYYALVSDLMLVLGLPCRAVV